MNSVNTGHIVVFNCLQLKKSKHLLRIRYASVIIPVLLIQLNRSVQKGTSPVLVIFSFAQYVIDQGASSCGERKFLTRLETEKKNVYCSEL